MAPKTKEKIRVIHNLGRCGGTLISCCVSVMENVALLSEINEHENQYQDYLIPHSIVQSWRLGLIDESDINQLNSIGRPLNLYESLNFIVEKAKAKNKKLIIRSWDLLDFIKNPFCNTSMKLSINNSLKDFDKLTVKIVRHPIQQYQSMKKTQTLETLLVEDYLKGYYEFLEETKNIPLICYEDFTNNPQKEMQKIADYLDINYDPSFINQWHKTQNITGDIDNTLSKKEIIPIELDQAFNSKLKNVFETFPEYFAIIEELGYGTNTIFT